MLSQDRVTPSETGHQTQPPEHSQRPGFGWAASSFANALLKEFSHWQWLGPQDALLAQLPVGSDRIARLAVNDEQALLIPVAQHSQTGLFRCYQGWWLDDSGQVQPVSLPDAASLLAQNTAQGDEHEHRPLAIRVDASQQDTHRLFAERDTRQAFAQNMNFIDSEQALLAGHPSHPCPRDKNGFDQHDARYYAPEYQGKFQLHWFAVHASALVFDSRGQTLAAQLWQIADSSTAAATLRQQVPAGFIPWPMHPWQAKKILELARVQTLVQRNRFIDLGKTGCTWSATSSLRCIYSPSSPYMLKYSISVQLTNSLRHLLPHEVERGMQVVAVWNSPRGRVFHQRYPHFHVIKEPAWLALADDNGEPIAATITSLRDNLFQEGNDQNIALLGTLCQLPPPGQLSQLGRIICAIAQREQTTPMTSARQWYEQFLKVAVEPMLMAQAEEGLLFGAHLQNTLLRLDLGKPTELYYRDCQGTGFSPIGSQLHRDVLTTHCDERNQLSETMGNYLFGYYFIVNTVFSVIGTIALDRLDNEQQLLLATRRFIERLRQRNPRDTSCLDYLLNSPTLFFKGNLRCSLIGQNETTMADPLALYTSMANPLTTDQLDTITQYTPYPSQESLPT